MKAFGERCVLLVLSFLVLFVAAVAPGGCTDWSTMPWYTYNGDTASGLSTLINTYGHGTYLCTHEINIDTTLIITQDQVRIVGSVGYPISADVCPGSIPPIAQDYSGSQGGKFNSWLGQGQIAIEVFGNGVEFENCELYMRGTANACGFLYYNYDGAHANCPYLHNVKVMNSGSGYAIQIYNSRLPRLDQVYVWQAQGAYTGSGICLSGPSLIEPHLTDVSVYGGYYGLYITGAQGLYAINCEFFDQYFPCWVNPVGAHTCDNLIFTTCIFDVGYSGASAESFHAGWGTYGLQDLQFSNCWFYGHNAALSIGACKYLVISGGLVSTAAYSGSSGYGIYLYTGVNKAAITGVAIRDTASQYAIMDNGAVDVSITGCTFDTVLSAALGGTYYSFVGNTGSGGNPYATDWTAIGLNRMH